MDRLDEFTIFLAIIDTGSLGGAARRVRRSTASTSRALAALEARLGEPLVERSARHMRLTEAGERFAEAARCTLAAYSTSMDRHASEAVSGVLRVTAPRVFGARHVAPVLAAFAKDNTGVTAELFLADQCLNLGEERIDVALRISRDEFRTVERRVGQVRHLVVATSRYISRYGEPQLPRDLADHNIVHIAAGTSLAEWRFRIGGSESIVRLSPRLSVNDIPAALSVVQTGEAIARPLSYQVAEELESGALVRLLRAYEMPPIPVKLVTASKHPPARVRAFLDFATDRLAALPVVQAESSRVA